MVIMGSSNRPPLSSTYRATPMKRAVVTLGVLIAVAGLTWWLPLFHIMPLEAETAHRSPALESAALASSFWNGPLTESFDQAADAAAVVAAIRDSPQMARERFGRTVGLSRAYYFYLRGTGTVVAIAPKGIALALEGHDTSSGAAVPDVILRTGLLFGNTVRDATGLLSAGDYSNSQHFNDISAALNRIVELEVLPVLKEKAAVGRRIEFVGCVEVENEPRDLRPLKVVPIHIEIEPGNDREASS
jgi:predicted lipoprotein